MRSLVMIFLLVLMPMQFTWAALSVYCPHETGASERQVDEHNHQHQHEAGADQEDRNDPHATGNVDADPGACHSGQGAVILGSGRLPAVSVSSDTYTAYQSRVPSPPYLPLPERPNWTDLA